MLLGYLLCYPLPPPFWKQVKIWEVETFSPLQVCKDGSRCEQQKDSCLSEYKIPSTHSCLLPCSSYISRIKISHSTAHGISPSFCTTTVNAGHIFVEQVSYSESRIYPFKNNFNKTVGFFFFPFWLRVLHSLKVQLKSRKPLVPNPQTPEDHH